MNGILIINKPAGWTSHDVIAKLRGVLRQKRIGHGGTLDPMATGVLPVFIGRATRAAEFCENADKEYIAELTLGTTTDTQDITGNILTKRDITVSFEELVNILPSFTGPQKQIPPMYSAIKKDGKKLYELARKGIDIPREPRNITIFKLETQNTQDTGTVLSSCSSITLRIVCSKGTYIRTLCHDIGEKLGCGGILSALKRTRAGVFNINQTHDLEKVIQASLTDSVNELILPTDSIFSDYPDVRISEAETIKAKNGAICKPLVDISPGKYRVYSHDNEFLLFGEFTTNGIKTIKSFFNV